MTLHPRWAWLLPLGWLALLLPPRVSDFVHDIDDATAGPARTDLVLGVTLIAAILLVTAVVVLRRGDARMLLAVLVVLVFGPKLLFGQVWIELAGPLCAAVLLSVRGRLRAWSLAIGIALADASTYLVVHQLGAGYLPEAGTSYLVANAFFRNVNIGISLFAVTRLAQLIQEADHSRRLLTAAEVRAEHWRASGRLRLEVGARLSAIRQRLRTGTGAGVTREDLAEIARMARDVAERARSVTDGAAPQLRTPLRAPDPATIAVPFLFAWWMLAGIIVCCLGTSFTTLAYFGGMSADDWLRTVLSATLAIGLQLYHGAPRRDATTPRWWPLTLAIQLGLVTAPVVFPALSTQSAMYILAVGAGLTLLRPPWSWILLAAAAAAAAPAMTRTDGPLAGSTIVYSATALIVGAATVYALCEAPVLTGQLYRTRDQLAHVAVTAERSRFARDVHDLLGFHLSAVTLTAELAYRELASDPGQARRRLETVREHTESAIAHVRDIDAAADVTLDEELQAAESVLRDAGVRATVHAPTAGLPPHLDRVLAVVVRESVTNIIRHSHARTCSITLQRRNDAVRLRVTNDGAVNGRPREAGGPGNGLANLAVRTRDAGGRFTSEPDGDTFAVTAELPL